MIGIYKITNKINGHNYIGQSINIERRWREHQNDSFNPRSKGYYYPLYCAFRKYGIDNFIFEVLEECQQKDLNKKEEFYIKKYQSEYNQTEGGKKGAISFRKLTIEQVKVIQAILQSDKKGAVSHKQLAIQYGVHPYTIRDINVGRTWHNDELSYPLHYSIHDSSKPKVAENNKENKNQINREELKKKIRVQSFVSIGKEYDVSDNAVRRWCKKYGLPFRTRDIKQYSDEDWELI